VLGHAEWSAQLEFADSAGRVRNRQQLTDLIEEVTVAAPRGHWLTLFEANDIPCGPINDYSQVFADPQVIAREMVVETEHPTLGRVKNLGSPIKMSAPLPDFPRRTPQLGEHTDEVLREAGFSSDEIATLRSSGAAR
jgi:crotonobetainyl-CoA:carnitine CoA-transferase CaiB-like acyl-CoA transferase